MKSKADITSEFIIRTVAPVFNKQGYSGTSLADITSATGLTKGAIYGNFKDKNELAVKAFVYNVKRVTSTIQKAIDVKNSSIDKLLAISTFYKSYFDLTADAGGCPILNVGIDSNHQNPELLLKVKKAIINLQGNMARIVEFGQTNNEIHSNIDADEVSRRFFSMIEGAVFMAGIFDDGIYMKDLGRNMDGMILNELKK